MNAGWFAAAAATLAALVLAAAASATTTAVQPPHVATSGVTHVHGSSGQLEGVVDPNNAANLSYFFKYGPTVAYGAQTKPVALATGSKPIKVGQPVTGLLVGWHYRIFADYTNAEGKVLQVEGKDKSFLGVKTPLKFSLPKGRENQIGVAYGQTAELTGSLTGQNNAGVGLQLQATPFPFTGAFTTLGGTVVSGRTGAFVFHIAHLTRNTEFRVLTLATRPLYSPVVTVHVSPRVVLHVRAGKAGLYRFYGDVYPARTGLGVSVQQLLPQKPGSKREGPRGHTVGSTVTKRATANFSRFSAVAKLSGSYRYRIYVVEPKGALESGYSSNVLVRAPKSTGTTKRKK